ncbi:TetR family transcriptional regulator [Amycolatopsis sp. NPDC059027]|uniref:TetR/AcrR family transcriptional regulator n=1 Tax=unclassified Amycolatopsis TaxID=2618356 RepID=UPI00366ECE58
MTRETRKRDAAATKAALLDAASELFAERGFDRTTVRDIAERAGANQALLFRYFGTKEQLFEAVVARNGQQQLAETSPEKLLGAALRSILDPSGTGQAHRAMATYLRSAASDSASTAIRRQISDEYAKTLATLTDAPDAELRADLVMAWVLGIGLVRGIATREPLASADPDHICRLVVDATKTLLERTE